MLAHASHNNNNNNIYLYSDIIQCNSGDIFKIKL